MLIETAGSPTDPVPARVHDAWPDDFPGAPEAVPGVVRALVRLAGVWRERLLRRCLAGHHDWTEAGLNLAVERPIAELLLGTGGGAADTRMRAELGAAGVVLDAVPSDLLALAWDLHLARGVRLSGADASVGDRPPADRAGPDRAVLRQFAAWAGTDADGVERMLVPACGAGRLLLECGGWAATHNIQLYALDPDPRAVLFATALVEREFGSRLACTIRTAHPLVEADLYDDPLARLIPEDARARLRPADWPSLFGGVECFDRVLIGDPAVPLTRRTAVQRYVEGRYATASGGTDPALLLVEAGARHLAPGGSVLALYPAAAYRAPTAAAFRRWLGARAEALVAMPGYCAVRVSATPLATPLLAGGFGEGETVLRSYPRSALDPASWTVTDPARAALLARLETGGAPLGDVLLGGVRAPAPAVLDPALLIGARDRRRLLRADRRAARAIRPVIAPEDVVRFGSARAASRFVIAGPLPPPGPAPRPRARPRAAGDGPLPPAVGAAPPLRGGRSHPGVSLRPRRPGRHDRGRGHDRPRRPLPRGPPPRRARDGPHRRSLSRRALGPLPCPAARSGSPTRTTKASARSARRSRPWPVSVSPSGAATSRARRPAAGSSRPPSTGLSNGSTKFRQLEIAALSEIMHLA